MDNIEQEKWEKEYHDREIRHHITPFPLIEKIQFIRSLLLSREKEMVEKIKKIILDKCPIEKVTYDGKELPADMSVSHDYVIRASDLLQEINNFW